MSLDRSALAWLVCVVVVVGGTHAVLAFCRLSIDRSATFSNHLKSCRAAIECVSGARLLC
jgi:hypothetical protein